MNSSAQNSTILVVADEVETAQELALCVENGGYRVLRATTGEQATATVASSRPDAILLEMGLPGMEELAFLKQLREQSRVPILVVSECAHETEKINALDGGANDYITRPFSTGELLARLRVAQRYAQPEKTEVFRCGPLIVDFTNRTVTVAGRRVRLTPTEYSLLRLLAKHAGKVLTYRQMLRNIWGPDQIDKIRCLRVYLRSLRAKLEPDPSHPALLITEPGVGIRLAL